MQLPCFVRKLETIRRQPRIDTRQPVGLQDLMPTILNIAGIEKPENITGSSTLPFLVEGDDKIREYLPVVCGQSFGLTDGRYSYSWFGDTGVELLFDHDNDPREEHDLSDLAEHQATKQRMREALIALLEQKNDKNLVDGTLTPKPSKWPIEDNRFTYRGMARGRC